MEKFLAFDSSGEELIVGASDGVKYKELKVVASGTENLLPTIDKVLKSLKLKIGDIEVVCVGVGPGSWTGSRVAVTTAFGFQSGNKNLKLCTFNSFDLISYNGLEKRDVVKLVKAYANFVYIQLMNGEILAITKDELNEKYAECVFVGITKVTENTFIVNSDLKTVATKLVENKEYKNAKDIEPMYLRLSQAEYQRMNRLGKTNGN